MFTGIIEEIGTIRRLNRIGDSAAIQVACSIVLADCRPGDSIAVNGACLTVTAFDTASFTAEMSSETLRRTTLGSLNPGGAVNLERALRLSDRLGGHLVTGHVDSVGTVKAISRQGAFVMLTFSAPEAVSRYLVEKGSVTVDGISLTVAQLTADGFTVAAIPHTLEITTLGRKQPGDTVNLEADIIGKYVEKLAAGATGERKPAGLTEETLAKFGFM